MRRVTKVLTMLLEHAGGNQFPEIVEDQPLCVAPLHLHSGIIPRLSDSFHPFGKRERPLVLGPEQMKHPLGHDQRHEVFGPIYLFG